MDQRKRDTETEKTFKKNNKASLTIKILNIILQMELLFADMNGNITSKEVKADSYIKNNGKKGLNKRMKCNAH